MTTYIGFMLSQSANSAANTNQNRLVASVRSESATLQAMEEIEVILQSGGDVPDNGVATVDGVDVAYTITQIGSPVEETDPTTSLQATISYFGIEAVAEVGGVRDTTRRIVRVSMIYAFQFAVFLENDLIVFAQADTEINGPVHVNGDMYLHTFRDLIFDTNYVATAGEIHFDPPYSSWGNYSWWLRDPEIRRWVADPYDTSEPVEFEDLEYESSFAGIDNNSDGDYDDWGEVKPFAPYALEQFEEPDFYNGGTGNTLTTAAHGTGTLDLPTVEDLAMFQELEDGDWVWNESTEEYVEVTPGTGTHQKSSYHREADLSILSYPDGSWRAFTNNGTEVTSSMASAVTATSMFDAYQASDAGDPDGEIQNTIIDLDELGSSGYFPDNGLLYVAGYGAGDGLDVKGFQLSNGSELADDLTVVSPNSIYVKGDYNTVNKKAASVIADAVSVLSNSWDDDTDHDSSPSAIASDTTYNMSVVAGDIEPTSSGWVIVGNILRRHERWTGRDENFNGSIVSHGYSQYATARPFTNWNGGPGYRPPYRRWNYDVALNDANNQPPFTPRIVKVSDAAIW